MDHPDLRILTCELSGLVLVADQGRKLPVRMGIDNGKETITPNVTGDASSIETISCVRVVEWRDLQKDFGRGHIATECDA